MSKIRLNKFLSRAGIVSRRGADELIQQGDVELNGKKAELGQEVDPKADRIVVNGEEVSGMEEKVYFKLNKPVGVVSTVSDPQGRPTVLEFTQTDKRVYPVGRLDQDSQGLILLTNDGHLAYRLTHPSHHIKKEYQVLVQGSVTEKKIISLQEGISLADTTTAPATVDILTKQPEGTSLRFILHEGKNRQIRRMCAAVDLHVVELKRIAIGPLHLNDLKPGECKSLTPTEITALKEAVS